MIFVTVGTRTEGFDRLVTWMDDVAGEIDDEVRMQIGHSATTPDNAKWFRFADDVDDIVALTRDADLVVGHGGAGTILTSLDAGTPIVCVPRRERHDENYDDHQLELTRRLADEGTIALAQTKAELADHVHSPPDGTDAEPAADLVPALERRLGELEDERR